MNPESDILDALLSHVEDLSFSPAYQIAWPNFPFAPTVGTKYIEARHLPNDSDRIMITGDTDRLYGILMLTINSPLNRGVEDVVVEAGEICDHFATDTKLRSGDVEIRITRRPVQKEGLNVDGWWKTPILVYYEAFV